MAQLQSLIDQDRKTIRETEFTLSVTFRLAWFHLELLDLTEADQPAVITSDGKALYRANAVVDKFGRVLIPVDLFKQKILGVSFEEKPEDASKNLERVRWIETRFEGEKEVARVLSFESKGTKE